MGVVEDIEWIVGELRRRGVRVEEVPGWRIRGAGAMRRVRGQLDHHDAVPASAGHAGGLRVCTFGRAGLRNSLCMFYLASDSTVYVVAAGVSWHAGRGVIATNSEWSSIEARYHPNDGPWPDGQQRTYDVLNAVCAMRWGYGAPGVRDHKEHAPGRKVDRSRVDPDARRAAVARIIKGGRVLLPTLRQGDRGDYVRALKALLNAKCGWKLNSTDPNYGPTMTKRVKEFQAFFQLRVDGVAGPETWELLLALPVR